MRKSTVAFKTAPETGLIKVDLAEAVNSFAELYDLLEDYSPMWYSEEIHDRAQSALILLRESLGIEPALKSPTKKQESFEYSVRNR
jgi:hypothetical protein